MSATPAERAAAGELTRELDTVHAEPTDADLAAAATILGWTRGLASYQALVKDEHGLDIERVAQALAAERAAIHARYEAVAAECDDAPDRDDMSEDWQDGRDEALLACSARIRQVAAQ